MERLGREPLLAAVADACYLTGQFAAGIAARQELIDIARRSGDREKEAFHLTWLAGAMVVASRTLEAEQPVRAAIEALEGLPPNVTQARVFRHRAFFHMVKRECAEASVWGRRAIELVERFDDLAALIVSGDAAAGRAELERGINLARASQTEMRELSLLANLGTGLCEDYQFPLAKQDLAEAIALADELGRDGSRDYITAWLACTHLIQGSWTEASDFARSVLARISEMPNSRIIAPAVLGRLRARRGDPESSTVLDEALAFATNEPALLWLGEASRRVPTDAGRHGHERDAGFGVRAPLLAFPPRLTIRHNNVA